MNSLFFILDFVIGDLLIVNVGVAVTLHVVSARLYLVQLAVTI